MYTNKKIVAMFAYVESAYKSSLGVQNIAG